MIRQPTTGREGTGERWSSPETAELVLAHLAGRVDSDGVAAASYPGLGRDLHIGRSTAKRAVTRLIDTGALVVSRVGTGHRYPSSYRVLRQPEPRLLRRAMTAASATAVA